MLVSLPGAGAEADECTSRMLSGKKMNTKGSRERGIAELVLELEPC